MPGARLSLDEREALGLGIASGRSLGEMARSLGRPVSTLAREVVGNGGHGRYLAVVAERATLWCACRPMPNRLAVDRALAREVECRLRWRHLPHLNKCTRCVWSTLREHGWVPHETTS